MAESKEKLTPEAEIKPEIEIKDLEKIREEEKLPPEVETWMRKVEKAKTTTVTDDRTGQPILTPSQPVSPKIVLPVTRKTFAAGFKKTIEEAGRWLSTFILRLIKIKKGEVKFKEEK